jgi:hypothetical protein
MLLTRHLGPDATDRNLGHLAPSRLVVGGGPRSNRSALSETPAPTDALPNAQPETCKRLFHRSHGQLWPTDVSGNASARGVVRSPMPKIAHGEQSLRNSICRPSAIAEHTKSIHRVRRSTSRSVPHSHAAALSSWLKLPASSASASINSSRRRPGRWPRADLQDRWGGRGRSGTSARRS